MIDALLKPGRSKKLIIALAATGLVASALWVLTLGAYDISVADVYRVLFFRLTPFASESPEKLTDTIVWSIRLPRVLLAVTAGLALATAGAVFQGVFRNPLVEPYILGVSAGAAFGATLGILFPYFFFSVQLSAFLFGAGAVFSTYYLARMNGSTPVVHLILAGVITGSIFTALVSILKYLSDDTALRAIVFWLMGGFYYATWKDVLLTTPAVGAGILAVWRFGWKLNVLSMGDEEARALGVNPEKYKILVVVIATLITALAVSACGIIAWVGLMMPHAARLISAPTTGTSFPWRP